MADYTKWADEKAAEILRKNTIGLQWMIFNTMNGVCAMDTEATTALVAAFDRAGFEMRQPGMDWEIRLKPKS